MPRSFADFEVAWARNGCHRYPGLAGRFRGNMQCFVGLPARLEWWRCRKRRNVFLDLCLSQRVRRFAMVYFTTQCLSILASHPNNISLAFCILAPQKARGQVRRQQDDSPVYLFDNQFKHEKKALCDIKRIAGLNDSYLRCSDIAAPFFMCEFQVEDIQVARAGQSVSGGFASSRVPSRRAQESASPGHPG